MNKDIYKIFEEHWEYYSKKTATDIAQITGLTKHISNEYEGRVVYELMQNAFDPASEFVKVDIKYINGKNYLVVSNDGTAFGYESFNHATQSIPNKDDNFHALCSIATSNKTVEENIGNKGVGFKSVFSLTKKTNEVYIVTKQKKDEVITFKLYGKIKKDEFLEIKNKRNGIDLSIQEKLFDDKEDMIIPGFYYPLLQEKNYLTDALDKDLKTAIVIPLTKDTKEKVKDLISEIENYHFEFIKERFKDDDEKKNLTVCINNKEFKKEKVEIFSKSDFAILWTERENDKYSVLYNFMPSLFGSPFKCIDIHGEFQTSINREHIDFDDKNDIGKKNLLILKKAIFFHFDKLKEVDIDENNKDIFWKLLQINNETLKPIIKSVLLEKYKNWNGFSSYIFDLAEKYFKFDNLTIENFNDFWKIIFSYFEMERANAIGASLFSREHNRQRFKEQYLSKLESIECIPITQVSNEKQVLLEKSSFNFDIFFKKETGNIKREKNNIIIPEFLKTIKITSYRLDNIDELTASYYEFKDIKLKKFTTYIELLKHFRQIPKDGNKPDKNINYSEQEQIEILNSLYSIYKDKEYLSSHRYSRFLTKEDRTKFNVENNAYFAISTIFLKTIDKDEPYKPAQLCRKKDLDLEDDFYSELKKKDNFDNFLKFLGVSFDNKYIFCEGEIYENYQKGLDYIPAVVNESIGRLEAKDIIPNISIINLGNSEKKFAWECYKNDHYKPILKEIKTNSKDKSLDEIVKSIKDYPKEYLDKLLERLKDNSNLEKTKKLYQVIFNRQLEVDSENENYLIYNNGRLELSTALEDVFIPKIKKDLNTIWEHRDGISKKFLMAFTDKFNSKDLKLVVVEEKI